MALARQLEEVSKALGFSQVGHVHLTAFNARAVTDVAAAVKDLESQGAAELVLDLRDNRGGLVQEGIEIAKLFLAGVLPTSMWPHKRQLPTLKVGKPCPARAICIA